MAFPIHVHVILSLVQLGPRKLSVIRSSGMSAIQGLLKIEVNGRTVGTFRIVRLSWVSAIEGCPLSESR